MSSAYDPNISFKVVDESNVVPGEPILSKKSSFLYGLFGSKGDRKFREFVRSTDLRSRLGSDIDDFEKYGQAGLNAVASIAGGASIYACRLLPEDAKGAYIVIGITTKDKAGIPQYRRLADGSFDTDAVGAKIQLLGAGDVPVVAAGKELAVVKITVADISNFDPAPSTTGGVTTYPIFFQKAYSEGAFGNNYGISLKLDRTRDRKLSDGRRYILNLFERDQSSVVSALTDSIYFSFSKNAVLPTNSKVKEALTAVYPRVLTSGEENPVQLQYFQENWDALMAALLPFAGTNTIHDIDPFTFLQKNGTTYDKIVAADPTMDLQDGVTFLSGGHDGSLQIGLTLKDSSNVDFVVDAAHVATTKESLLVKFFSCDYNAELLDRRLIPAGFALDANYSTAVKSAMIGLSEWRDDIVRIIDFGLAARTPKAALTKYFELITYVDTANAWNIVFAPHAGVTTDLPDNKRVTQTYEMAWDIPSVYSAFGRFTTVAGSQTGRVRHMSLDWTAQLSKDNMIEKLNDAGLVYAQYIDRSGIPVFMNETSQYNKPYSKLKHWRNGAVVGDAMRNSAAILIKYNFDPRGATAALDAARRELNQFFGDNAYPNSVKVEVNLFQSANDKMTDNASCEILFYFPGELKAFSVTIRARREEDFTGGN